MTTHQCACSIKNDSTKDSSITVWVIVMMQWKWFPKVTCRQPLFRHVPARQGCLVHVRCLSGFSHLENILLHRPDDGPWSTLSPGDVHYVTTLSAFAM